jgi:hypothetical protein
MEDVRRTILENVKKIPDNKQDTPFVGTWSCKELLAHFIGWDFTNIDAIKSLQAMEVPGFYAFVDADWRRYNALLIDQYWEEKWELLTISVTRSHAQLISYVKDIPVLDFFKDWGVRYKGYKVTIPRLLESELKDEKTHLDQIIQWKNGFTGL